MFAFLRALALQPIEWSQAVGITGNASPEISRVLEGAFSIAQAIVVILSGDDLARLREEFLLEDEPEHERLYTPQARPNVLFEAGMAFGTHPQRTVLVQIGSVRPFSDIAGRHIVRLDNTSERRQELAQRLRTAGCKVDLSGTDWYRVGDFESSTLVRYKSSSSVAMEKKEESRNLAVLAALAYLEEEAASDGTNEDKIWVTTEEVAGRAKMRVYTAGDLLWKLQEVGLVETTIWYDGRTDCKYMAFKLAQKGREALKAARLM